MRIILVILSLLIGWHIQGQTRNPYLRYTFDNVSTDSSGNGHTLTLYGNASYSTTQKAVGSHALYLDGTNDYGKINNLDLGTSGYIIAVHVYSNIDLDADRAIFGDSDSSDLTDNFRLRTTTTSKIRTYLGTNSAYSTPEFSISANTWTHILAYVHQVSGNWVVRLYKDGVKLTMTGSDSIMGTSFDPISRFVIGVDNYLNADWSGYIDELIIWKGFEPKQSFVDSAVNKLYLNTPIQPIARRRIIWFGTQPRSSVLVDPEPEPEPEPEPSPLYLSHNQYMVTHTAVENNDIVGTFDPWYCSDDTMGTYSYSLVDNEGGIYAINSTTGIVTIANKANIASGTDTLIVRVSVDGLTENYSAFVTVKASVDCKFIDPSASTNGTGTRASPYNTWQGISYTTGKAYFQKRGTTWGSEINITGSGTAGNEIYIGAYGVGNRPTFTTNSGTTAMRCKGSYVRFFELKFTGNLAGWYKDHGVEPNYEVYSNLMVSDLELSGNYTKNGMLGLSCDFIEGTWPTPSNTYENIYLYDIVTHHSVNGYGIKVEGGKNTVMENIKAYSNAAYGISLTWGSKNVNIKGYLGYDNAGSGAIELSGKNHELSYSTMKSKSNNDVLVVDDPGSSGSYVHHNIFEGGYYKGAIVLDGYSDEYYISWPNTAWDFTFEYNDIRAIGGNTGFSTYSGFRDVTISNCKIHGFNQGIRLGRASITALTPGTFYIFNNQLYNNTKIDIVADTSSGTGNGLVDSVFIYNNTCTKGINLSRASNPRIIRNNFYNRLVASGATASNNLITNPNYFVDFAGYDFRLKPTATQAIGNGLDISDLFTIDFFGNTRSTWDIGAIKH